MKWQTIIGVGSAHASQFVNVACDLLSGDVLPSHELETLVLRYTRAGDKRDCIYETHCVCLLDLCIL